MIIISSNLFITDTESNTAWLQNCHLLSGYKNGARNILKKDTSRLYKFATKSVKTLNPFPNEKI